MGIFKKSIKTEPKLNIDYLGSSLFCIQDFTQTEVGKLFQIENIKLKPVKESIKFLFPENNWDEEIDNTQLKIIISPNYKGWVFIKCELNDYNEIKETISNLNTKTSKKINYYYVDSHIDYYSWILSDNGKTKREFRYSMEKVMNSKGAITCELEKKFESQSEQVFGEDVYEEVAKTNGVSLSILNENLNDKDAFLTGTFNKNALQQHL